MLTENQKIWIEALRSGNYEQGQDHLRDENDRFCCLGVACDLFSKHPAEPSPDGRFYRYGNQSAGAPDDVIEALRLYTFLGNPRTYGGKALSTLNDIGCTFEEIADILEANPSEYFENA